MEKIIGPSGTGKTRKLMQLALDNNGYFICRAPEAMIRKAHAYGIAGLKVLSYDEYEMGGYDNTAPLYMDEPYEGDTALERRGIAGIARTVQ